MRSGYRPDLPFDQGDRPVAQTRSGGLGFHVHRGGDLEQHVSNVVLYNLSGNLLDSGI